VVVKPILAYNNFVVRIADALPQFATNESEAHKKHE